MFQPMVKMVLLGPFCLGFLLILFIEGIHTKERVVQMRRGKRDVDILVACDEHCLPEDQIKDYDVLLQYDELTTPGPFLSNFERKSCAFPCKIVKMNNTNGSTGVPGGDLTVVSVEESPHEYESETSNNVSDFHSLSTKAGLQKSVFFSPSICENVTTKSEHTNTTSTCVCTNNTKPLENNVTESTVGNQNSSSLFVNDNKENSTAFSDFEGHNGIVVSETTPQKQQFSVVPVVPKVIRFTVVEAEMAEALVTTVPSVNKTKDNSYFDVNNNVSTILKRLIEKLAGLGAHDSEGKLESFELEINNNGNEKSLKAQNLTKSTFYSTLSPIKEEVTITQTLPTSDLSRTRPILETSNSENSTKSEIETELKTIPSFPPSPAPPQVIYNIFNLNGAVATTAPPLLKASPIVTFTSVEHSPHLMDSNISNAAHEATSPMPESSSKITEVHTTESPKQNHPGNNIPETTPSLPSKGTTGFALSSSNAAQEATSPKSSSKFIEVHTSTTESSKQKQPEKNIPETKPSLPSKGTTGSSTDVASTTTNYVVTQQTGNESVTTENKLNQISQQEENSDQPSQNNSTKFKDDVGNVTGNRTIEYVPFETDKPVNLNKVSDEIKKNNTIFSESDMKSTPLVEKEPHKFSLADFSSPNIPFALHNESFSPDSLKLPNITETMYGELFGTSSLASTQPQHLQGEASSIDLSNLTDFSSYNNTAVGNLSSNLHSENNIQNINKVIINKKATPNETTTLHKV